MIAKAQPVATNIRKPRYRLAAKPLVIELKLAERLKQIHGKRGFDSEFSPLPEKELWGVILNFDMEIKQKEKRIFLEQQSVTGLRWMRGQALLEIKRRTPHGKWEKVLKEHKIQSPRASEDMRIARHFETYNEACKVRHTEAMKVIRKSTKGYNVYENCFRTPDWVRDAITRDYGFPGLDVASSHNMHFGETFYTPQQDGRKQDWLKDCGGKVIWMNCPHNKLVLPEFVEKSYTESQRGCVTINLLPFWRNYAWFNLVKQYAEVRLFGAPLIMKGFGPKEGKCVGNIPFRGNGGGRREFEFLLAIFRKDQQGFCSDWLDPNPAAGADPKV